MTIGYVTNKGINMLMDRLYNSAPTYSYTNYAQLGACAKSPTISDTKVIYPLPATTSSVAVIDDCETADWTAEGDGDTPTLNATAGYHLEGSNSLNLLATYSAGSCGFYKTFANFSVVDKYFCVPMYISDLTDISNTSTAIIIKLGTGGFTDYNQYNINRNTLQTGWNFIVCDGNTPDTTGGSGATEATINRIKITISNTGSLVANDIVMDWIQTYDKADTYLAFDSGYPSLNEGTKTATLRFNINSTQGNGYYFRECGIWDNTKTYLYSRDVYSSVNKDQYISLTIEENDEGINT